jgi:hypothetical protein
MWDDLNYLRLKLSEVKNANSIANPHEQGANTCANMRLISKKFGSNFMNFGALDNYLWINLELARFEQLIQN